MPVTKKFPETVDEAKLIKPVSVERLDTFKNVEVAFVATKVAIVPRLVREEPVTPEPSVDPDSTPALLMRNTPPVGKLTLPVESVIPP